jgi:hypothetical protein
LSWNENSLDLVEEGTHENLSFSYIKGRTQVRVVQEQSSEENLDIKGRCNMRL